MNIGAKDFRKILATLKPAHYRRATLPVLGCVRFDSTGATITDLELAITVHGFDWPHDTICVDYSALTAAVKVLSGPLTIAPDISGGITITHTTGEMTLPTVPGEDYPAIQHHGERAVGGMDIAETRVMLPPSAFDVAVACSKDDWRPILTGVWVSVTLTETTLAATDSYRLAVVRVLASATGPGISVVVPERFAKVCGKAKSGVTLILEPHRVTASFDSLTVSTRVIDGEFPNWAQLIPTASPNTLTLADVDSALTAIKTIEPFGALNSSTANHNVQLTIDPTKEHVTVSLAGSEGSGTATFAGKIETSDTVTFGFDARNLREGFAFAGDTFAYRDALKPCLIGSVEVGRAYLIMPVRLG